MATTYGCVRESILCSADENQVGQLQLPFGQYPVEHRIGQKAIGLLGIYRRARNDPPAGTDAQQPFYRIDGSIPAEVALLPGRVEPVAGQT